jgi:hypothetical protein
MPSDLPPLPSRELARLLLALTLGEPMTRDDGLALALEVLRLHRALSEVAMRSPPSAS